MEPSVAESITELTKSDLKIWDKRKMNIYTLRQHITLEQAVIATLGSNLGISTLLEILQSCKLDHKVA